jgi:TolA-binding protein
MCGKMKLLFFTSIFLITIILSGCSKKTDEQYLNEAKTSVENKNIDKAVTAYQDLIKEYPKSPKAPEAIFQLATLYQNKMVKDIPANQSLQKAISLFRSVFDKYPKSKLAPKALFMSGFILANDLKSYNQATASFSLFLQKFPNNELASSAREELENMGLTPEEILQKKKNVKADVSNVH